MNIDTGGRCADAEWNQQHNILLPKAERETNDHIKRKDYDNQDDYSNAWNRFFFKKMNYLAKKAGIAWIE